MTNIILTQYDGAILGPIARLLGWVMNGIYNLMDHAFGIQNIGLSIIILTFVIYLCMLPVTYKQQKYSKLSQQMQPELLKVQKKYEGKKDQASMQRMQEESQMIYGNTVFPRQEAVCICLFLSQSCLHCIVWYIMFLLISEA